MMPDPQPARNALDPTAYPAAFFASVLLTTIIF